MNQEIKKEVKTVKAERDGLKRQYVKPVLSNLGNIVVSTFGSSTKLGDQGGRGMRL